MVHRTMPSKTSFGSSRPGARPRSALLALALLVFASAARGADGLADTTAGVTDAAAFGATLGSLLAYAREHNPDLAGRRLESAAARARIESAGALPDPRFQLELMDFTEAEDSAPAAMGPGEAGATRYRVIQPIPFWGKRGLKTDIAAAESAQRDALQQATLVDVEARIKTAFVQSYEAVQQARILRDTLALVEALERIVLTRYSVGLVPQQDAIRVQSEITTLKVELVEAERAKRDASAKLNAALSRPADAPLAEPLALYPVPVDFSLAALRERLRSDSPELAGDRAGVAAAEKTRASTYRNRYPDFALGLTNNQPRRGADSWDLMLEVDIPLQQGARRAQEREAERSLEAAQTAVMATAARLEGRLGQVWAVFEASREKARLLHETLLPQAEATYRAAEAGYETGRVDFNAIIDAERQILRTRLELLEAEVEMRISVAELEQLVGAPL